MGFAQIAVERVESPLPELAVAADPVGGLGQRRRLERAASHASLLARPQKAGALEGFDVFQERGKRHRERVGQVGHGGLAPREPGQDGPPGGVGEGGEGRVESLHTLNHKVKCMVAICQVLFPSKRPGFGGARKCEQVPVLG